MGENAEALFDYLAGHPKVEAVHFPKSERPDLYGQVRRAGAGYGSLMSILLKDSATEAPRAYDALRVSKGPSLGTNFSLVCPYTLLAHYPELEWAEKCGVHRDLIRISVGLEEEGDLISRFAEALD
jgi:cystathionine gamma-synthase